MKKSVSILWGIAFIIVGVIIALNSLEITNINIFFDGWWTLFIIVPCFIDLFDGDDLTGSIIGIIVGVALLLCCQNIITFELIWKLALPVILVLIGLSIIFRNTVKFDKKILEKDKNELEIYCTTFGSQTIDLTAQKFNGANISAIFGGVEMNLNDSKISDDVIIYATAIFGSIDIKVPENFNVVVKSFPVFGGVTNKHKNSKDEKVKTIYIKGISIFGGVEIK